jgi:hypothetical protein
MRAGQDRRTAVADVAASLGVPKRQAYDVAVRLQATGDDGPGSRFRDFRPTP